MIRHLRVFLSKYETVAAVGSKSCTLIDTDSLIRKQDAVANIADVQTRRSSPDSLACGSGVSLSNHWSRGAQKYSRHRWSGYLERASTTTCAGTVGGGLGQRCLSGMERPSKSCLHGGDGAQSSLPAGMWLPGKTVPGVMSIYPDHRWWRGRSDSGNLSKVLHAQPRHYGQCHSRRGEDSMVGGRMIRTSTTEPTWKPWVPLTRRMEPKRKRAQSRRGSNLQRRDQNQVPKRMDLVYLQPWDQSLRRPRGSPRRPECPVERHMSTSPARSEN